MLKEVLEINGTKYGFSLNNCSFQFIKHSKKGHEIRLGNFKNEDEVLFFTECFMKIFSDLSEYFKEKRLKEYYIKTALDVLFNLYVSLYSEDVSERLEKETYFDKDYLFENGKLTFIKNPAYKIILGNIKTRKGLLDSNVIIKKFFHHTLRNDKSKQILFDILTLVKLVGEERMNSL